MEPGGTGWPPDTGAEHAQTTLLGMERALLPRPRTDGEVRSGSGRVRVVVVDDNAGFRESLLALLDAGDLDVVGEARSGSEALGLIPETDPDVVLMDVRMPEMDGIETTRRLKALHPSIGVVGLSGPEDQG